MINKICKNNDCFTELIDYSNLKKQVAQIYEMFSQSVEEKKLGEDGRQRDTEMD